MHTLSTTLTLATFLLSANLSAAHLYKNCEGHGTPGRTADWHANTDEQWHGGDVDLCACIAEIVDISWCKVSYKFPDGKSAWGKVTYCSQGNDVLTGVCLYKAGLGNDGRGYIMSG